MDTARAIDILRSLADMSRRSHSVAQTDGRNPVMRLRPRATAAHAGEQFPPDSPYQLATAKLPSEDGQADTVRVLITA